MMRRIDILAIVIMGALATFCLWGCPHDEMTSAETAPGAPTTQAPTEEPVAMAPAEPAEVAPMAPVAPANAPESQAAATEPAPAPPASAAPAATRPPASPPAPAMATPPQPAPAPAQTTVAPPEPSTAETAHATAAPSEGTVVIGRITVVSHVPDPSEVPYTDCLTMIKYAVEEVVSGSYAENELLAAFWGMRDARLQPAAHFRVGQRHRLVIEPLAEHPELQRVMQADDTNEFALAPQWVVEYKAL